VGRGHLRDKYTRSAVRERGISATPPRIKATRRPLRPAHATPMTHSRPRTTDPGPCAPPRGRLTPSPRGSKHPPCVMLVCPRDSSPSRSGPPQVDTGAHSGCLRRSSMMATVAVDP
jgi:hypothetical protein